MHDRRTGRVGEACSAETVRRRECWPRWRARAEVRSHQEPPMAGVTFPDSVGPHPTSTGPASTLEARATNSVNDNGNINFIFGTRHIPFPSGNTYQVWCF